GRVRMLRKHRERMSLPCLAPAVCVAGIVVGALAAAMMPALRWPFGGALAIYALVVLAVSARLAWKARDARLGAWLPLVFAAIHSGAGMGVLVEIITARQRARTPLWHGLLTVPRS